MLNRDRLMRNLEIAKGTRKAETVLKNCRIVSVFTSSIIEADIAIEGGVIAAIGSYEGETNIDIMGGYVAPGLIDAHMHLESTMATPSEISKVLLPTGTTTVICDPHEIANVSGIRGICYIIEASRKLPLNVYVNLPSCVPATAFEDSGAELSAADLESLIESEYVLGLAEVMDFPAVIAGDEKIWDKIHLAHKHGKIIDGHAPALTGKSLAAYIGAGISTDHECTTASEMKERLDMGQYVIMREGSAAKNVETLIKAVNKDNLSRVLFCTDDKHPEGIYDDGHIDNIIRLAVKCGLDIFSAIKIATINAANCYGLSDLGAIAPNRRADLVILDDLETFKIREVYKDGIKVAEGKKPLFSPETYVDEGLTNTVRLPELNVKSIEISLKSDRANVIKLLPFNIVTEKAVRSVNTQNGVFAPTEGILKAVVCERHSMTGNIGLALIEGFGIKKGAIASSVAHDSHNIIAIGDNDKDILAAIAELSAHGGGITVVSQGKPLMTLPLPIAGLMSTQPVEAIGKALYKMKKLCYEMGVSETIDPFMTLAFLSLPIIPHIKVTDRGLFDVDKFEFINISEGLAEV